ncbi:hypothetical protein SK128_005298, partial [Halocaridina rubra]
MVNFVAVIVTCQTSSLDLKKLDGSPANGTRKTSLQGQDCVTKIEVTTDSFAEAKYNESQFNFPINEKDFPDNNIGQEAHQIIRLSKRSYINKKIAKTSEGDNVTDRNNRDLTYIAETNSHANKSTLVREESSLLIKNDFSLAKDDEEPVGYKWFVDYSYDYPLIPDDTEEIARDFHPDKFTNIANMMEGIVSAMKSIQESEADSAVSVSKIEPLSATTEVFTADDDSTTINITHPLEEHQ